MPLSVLYNLVGLWFFNKMIMLSLISKLMLLMRTWSEVSQINVTEV